ncbi:MAG TPA: hypothetical protein VK590_11435, partial [Saprospiraceae bacterium]|nr:hypothetical protein [Saprospiraceae bacterium]
MKRLIQVISIFFISSFTLYSQQSDLLIGQWKNFYPFKFATHVTQSENEVYYASPFAIVVCDKGGNVKETVSRIEGLNDIDLSQIKYSPYKNSLMITYEDGNIDLYRGKNDVSNINDLKTNANILGRKTINHINLVNDSLAILCADFGIMILDLAKEEFRSTVFTPSFKTNSSCYLHDTLYVSTDVGVYVIPNNINIQDFNQWRLLTVNNSTKAYVSTSCTVYNNALYMAQNDTLWKYQSGIFKKINYKKNFKIVYLSAEGEHLIAGLFCTASPGCSGYGLAINKDDFIAEIHSGCLGQPVTAVEDQNQIIWVGDGYNDYKRYDLKNDGCAGFQLNSPQSHESYDMMVYKNKTYITAGSLSNGTNATFNSSGFYIYDNSEKNWTNVNRNSFPVLNDKTAFDLLSIVANPKTDKIYSASFLGGLVEYSGDAINVFDSKSQGSKLQVPPGDTNRTRVAGLAFDKNNNLWMSNNFAPNPIVVLKKDGTWQNFPVFSNTGFYQMTIDQYNNKWFVIGGISGGLYVFNEGSDINNTADDKWREITGSNSNLPSNTVNCVTVDLKGDVWVGTSKGTIVFECSSDPFSTNCKGTKRIVQQDGFGAYLLETENVKVIKVDGADRKWFGTDNGVFVQSADGEKQIYHFDTKNSPLSSNSITAMVINNENGE